MAERRMFAKTIIDSDAFLEMPQSSQLLYFHLAMRGDDDGFINKPKAIMSMIGAKEDDMKVLIAKKFVIPFESGVVVIKHWRIHNYIRRDTYTETKYKAEKALLGIDENNAYRIPVNEPLQLRDEPVTNPSRTRDEYVEGTSTQVRLGKDRLGKVSIDTRDSAPQAPRFSPPTIEEVTAYCHERGNTVEPQHFIDFYSSKGWMIGKNKMKDWKAAVRTWEQHGDTKSPQGTQNIFAKLAQEGAFDD